MTDDQARSPSRLPRYAGYAAVGLGAVAAGLSVASTLLARDAERRVPPDGEQADIDGARLHYVDQGSGPPIVMVHGLGGQLRNFTYALTERLQGHRLIVVDRPRSGYSDAAPGPEPDIRAQARLVVRLIEQLGLERPLLVGHSLGGAVSLAAALAAPHRIGALALLAPLSQVEERVPDAFRIIERRSEFGRSLLARVYGVPVGRLTQRFTLREIFAPDPVPADFPTRGGGLLALRPDSMKAAMFEIAAARDDLAAIVPRYREIGLPVHILFGREDALLDPERHGRLTANQLPRGRFEMIEGGHMLPVTHPDETARFIRAALPA